MHTSNCLGFARVVGLQFYFVLICTFLSSFLHWAIHNTPTHNLSHFDKSWKFISFKGATWVGVLFFNRKLGSDWFNYSPDIFHWGLILVIYIYIYIYMCVYMYTYIKISWTKSKVKTIIGPLLYTLNIVSVTSHTFNCVNHLTLKLRSQIV